MSITIDGTQVSEVSIDGTAVYKKPIEPLYFRYYDEQGALLDFINGNPSISLYDHESDGKNATILGQFGFKIPYDNLDGFSTINVSWASGKNKDSDLPDLDDCEVWAGLVEGSTFEGTNWYDISVTTTAGTGNHNLSIDISNFNESGSYNLWVVVSAKIPSWESTPGSSSRLCYVTFTEMKIS